MQLRPPYGRVPWPPAVADSGFATRLVVQPYSPVAFPLRSIVSPLRISTVFRRWPARLRLVERQSIPEPLEVPAPARRSFELYHRQRHNQLALFRRELALLVWFVVSRQIHLMNFVSGLPRKPFPARSGALAIHPARIELQVDDSQGWPRAAQSLQIVHRVFGGIYRSAWMIIYRS